MYDLKCLMCGKEAKHRHGSLMCSCGNLMIPKPKVKKVEPKKEVKDEPNN